MRIVVLGTRGLDVPPGGIETYCANLYPLLADRGCEVILFSRATGATDGSVRPAAEPGTSGVAVVPIACSRNRHLETIHHTLLALWRARALRPDIAHFHGIGPSLLVPLARLFGMRTVIRHVGSDYRRSKWGSFARAVLRLGERVGLRYADAVVCITPYILREMAARSPHSRLHMIPNGMPRPRRRETTAVLEHLGITPGRYVLAVGRLEPEKGFPVLVDAFERTLAERGWKLVIAGGNPYETRFARSFRERCRDSRAIVAAGPLKGRPLEELYSWAGLFVIPSFHEGMSFALLEALSYDLPCIASDIPGNRFLGLDEEDYFAPGDVEGLGRRLLQRASREGPPRGGHAERIGREFDWEEIAGRTMELFSEVATR